MDAVVNPVPDAEVVRRHPRLEDWTATLKILLKNKVAMVGMVITAIYFFIALLDWVFPQYLMIPNGNPLNLSDALATFHKTAGVVYNGIAFQVGIPFSPPPYGTPGAKQFIIPPTLNGPTNTPGWWWWLGGTVYNLPIFPLMLAALKWDLYYTLIIVIIGAAIGTIIGTLSGYFGGLLDEFLMRTVDIFFSLPFLVLAIAIIYTLGRNIMFVVLALVIVWWPTYARLTRGLALSVKSNKFIEAATASGSSNVRNTFNHVLPNVLAPVFVQISLDLGTIIQIFATLDFLGIPFSKSIYLPEIGSMMNWGDSPALLFGPVMNWWPILIPGIFLVIFTVAVNLFGDGLRDVLDPKLRR